MVFDGFLLISFYFFVFILPGSGIIFGIIELKNRTSNKNAVSKKENNRFGIYGMITETAFYLMTESLAPARS